MCDDIDLFGHSGVVLKGDGEPALVQVQSAIKEKRTHPTICQNPPAYNPQSSRSAERAVQEVMSQVRAMKVALEQRLGTTVKTDWKALEWMVELSAVLTNRCLVGWQNTIFSIDGEEQLQGISGVRREGLGRGHSHPAPHIHPEAGSHEPLGGRHLGGRCEEVQ